MFTSGVRFNFGVSAFLFAAVGHVLHPSLPVIVRQRNRTVKTTAPNAMEMAIMS